MLLFQGVRNGRLQVGKALFWELCRNQPQKAKFDGPPGRQVCAGQTRNRALQLDRASLLAGYPAAKKPEGCVRVVRRCCRVLG